MLKRKDEDESYLDNMILKNVEADFGDHHVSQSQGQYIIVRRDGKKMRMRSGKAVWTKKGPASNALSCHLGRVPEELKAYFKDTTAYKRYLIEKGHVSIVEIK